MGSILLRERKILSKYILIFSGHNFWNRHEFKVTKQRFRRRHIPWKDVISPICNHCQDDTTITPEYEEGDDDRPLQTTEHIFTECEAFAALRSRVFYQPYGTPLHELKINSILRFIFLTKLDVLPADSPE